MLFAWAVFKVQVVMSGASGLPLVSLGLGFLGSLAVIAASALLSIRGLMKPLRYTGENSIVVYLAFFLPMAVTRILLLKFAPGLDTRTVAFIVTSAGVVTPLIFHRAVRQTALRFLFVRPAWAKLKPRVPIVRAETA